MVENKKEITINFSSKMFEKTLDIAKEFVDKLIMPSVEETGLLLKERITFYKLQNQVKMLNKAKSYCEKHKINPKHISLKLFCPLLEGASIEEDEDMQDKWARLLGNLADSDQNFSNNVFPFLLGQVSSKEFHILDLCARRFLLATRVLYQAIDSAGNELVLTNKELIERMANDISLVRSDAMFLKADLKKFEIANLIRLGLLKEEITAKLDDKHKGEHKTEVIVNSGLVITELGLLFIAACSEKDI